MELHHRPAFDASLNVKQLFRGVALAPGFQAETVDLVKLLTNSAFLHRARAHLMQAMLT
jgi:hypothetical protein